MVVERIGVRAERGADVVQLMENARGDVDHLAGIKDLPLSAETHLAVPRGHKIDFLLVLVVPWHLAAARLQNHGSHAEVHRLNRGNPAGQSVRGAPRRIAAALDFASIGDEHGRRNCCDSMVSRAVESR